MSDAASSASTISSASAASLHRTPLHALHVERGAKIVPFAGYALPVTYPAGLIAEHRQVRESAGLFDVSHMGQLIVRGPRAAALLESLMPVDVIGLATGRQRYGLLLNDTGGIVDDLMFTHRGEDFFVVVNGAGKVDDLALLNLAAAALGGCEVVPLPDHALLALQGPRAVDAAARLLPGIDRLVFMTGGRFAWRGAEVFATRSGYSGEDGFELSIHGDHADAFARALLAEPGVAPAGLGARNSLRLEAGLCLYGNDIDGTTSPVEAGLGWAMQKVRRAGGERAGGFPGAARILAELAGNVPPARKRVGLVALERVPVREPAPLVDAQGAAIGIVTSGLLAPTIDRPIAMGYVAPGSAAAGTRVAAMVRGKPVAMEVAAMPFVPHRYFRG